MAFQSSLASTLKPKQAPTPTGPRLATRIKTKYPGEYDDISDDELEKLITTKYPGEYDDLVAKTEETKPTEVRKPSITSWKDVLDIGTGRKPLEVPEQKTPSAVGRLAELFGGIANQVASSRLLNPLKLARDVIDPVGAVKNEFQGARQQYAQPVKEIATSKHPLWKTAEIAAETYGIPVSNIIEDFQSGSLGAGAIDIGQAALALTGLRKGYKALRGGVDPSLLPKKPAVEVLPPAGPVSRWPQNRLTQTAGVDPRTLQGKGFYDVLNNQQRPALGPAKPIPLGLSGEKFVSHPSGGVANAFDPSSVEALRGMDARGNVLKNIDFEPNPAKKNSLPPIESLPKEVKGTVIESKPLSDVDVPTMMGADFGLGAASEAIVKQFRKWAKGRKLPFTNASFAQFTKEENIPFNPISTSPESYSMPRSMGIGERETPAQRMSRSGQLGKGRQIVPIGPEAAEAIKRKKISGEVAEGDYLSEDPLMQTVPNRLRPEAPNVTGLRSLSEGSLERPLPSVEMIDEAEALRRNWGKPATTVELGQGLRRPPAGQRLAMPVEPDLPTAVRPTIPGEGTFSKLKDRPIVKLTPTPFVSGREFIEPSRITEIPGKMGGMSAIEKLKAVADKAKKAKEIGETLPDVEGVTPGKGKKTVLENPSQTEVDNLRSKGWKVIDIDHQGNVTMENIGIQAAKVEGEVTWRKGYKQFAEKNPKFNTIMQKLIKARSASDLIGKGIRDKFEDIAAIPKEKIVQFQKDLTAGKYPKVREFYDKLHERMTNLGIQVGKKEDYLTQMWDNTPEEIAHVFGDKELNAKASFQYRSFIKDYEEGMSKGLKPKMAPAELLEWYGKRAEKLIADQAALKELKENGYLVRPDNAKPGMLEIDPNLGSFKGYYAHPSVKKTIENYLKSSAEPSGFLDAIEKGMGKAGSLTLSSGVVPKRPLFTAHGLSIGSPIGGSAILEGGLKGGFRALKFGLSTKRAKEYLKVNNEKMISRVQEFGAKFNVENPHARGEDFFSSTEGKYGTGKAKEWVNKLTGLQNKYFEKPLFDHMIPAIKHMAWEDRFAKLQKKGMSREAAGKAATEISDNFFSGKNMDLVYQNKLFRSLGRIALIAPDWFNTTARLGIKIPESFIKLATKEGRNNPATKAYRAAGYRMMATYAAADVMQKVLSGSFMHENDTDELFTMKMGEDVSGEKRRGLPIFNSATDFVTKPLEIAMRQINEGGGFEAISEEFENRLSSGGRAALSVATGENYRGEANVFRTRDRFGRPIPFSERVGNTLSQTVNFGPPQIAQPINLATGRATAEEALSRIAETKLSYRKKKKAGLTNVKFK